jgi:PAS domain S-box-containing protein
MHYGNDVGWCVGSIRCADPERTVVNSPERDQQYEARLKVAAEARLARCPPDQAPARPVEDLLHELQVHQIELEMQNEALRQAQTALEESRDHFVDFYEFAPVGYLTLSDKGLIVDINQTAVAMLGAVRAKLLQRRFSSLVGAEDADRWHSHFFSALKQDQKSDCELTLRRKDGSLIEVELNSLRLARGGLDPTLRVVLTDITRRKRAERQLAAMAAGLEQQVSDRTQRLRAVSAQLARTEENERRLLAQELHDNLIQVIFTIKIKLSLLAPGSPRSAIDHIAELADQAERAARLTMQQLSPPILKILGLVPVLKWLIHEMARTHGLVVHFHSEGRPEPLVDEVQTILFRCARELLVNVAKHAGACDTSLFCLFGDSELVLVVSDDGCGFDPAGRPGDFPLGSHFGLSAIHERMINIGGMMEVDSSPGHGTMITLTVPYSTAAKKCQPS